MSDSAALSVFTKLEAAKRRADRFELLAARLFMHGKAADQRIKAMEKMLRDAGLSTRSVQVVDDDPSKGS